MKQPLRQLSHRFDMLSISPAGSTISSHSNHTRSLLSASYTRPLHPLCLCWCFAVLSSSPSPPYHTLPSAEVPQVTDVTFQDVSDTSISLSWMPFNTTSVTGYKITVTAAGESVPIFEDFVLPTSGEYTVYGLEPGIDYDISVITLTENGESEPTTFTQQTCKSES